MTIKDPNEKTATDWEKEREIEFFIFVWFIDSL